MKIDVVINYILDKLESFIFDNKLDILNKKGFGSYGFEICIGNTENYVFINYSTHIYSFAYKMLVGFGKRAFINDKDLDYVAMKPHYTINDFYKDFNLHIVFNFKKDKEVIDELCKIIPPIFNVISSQSDKYFFEHCPE